MSEIPKKLLYEYNGEYSYKTWDKEHDKDDSKAFFELHCKNGNRNITFKQALEFIGNDIILFDDDEDTYMSIGQLDKRIYKTYIQDSEKTVVRNSVVVLKEQIEDNMIGDICLYLLGVFEDYDYYIQEQKTEKDKEKFFQNLIRIFQIYLIKREDLVTDINYLIETLSDEDNNKRVLEVFLIRLISNMTELCGNKTFSFGKTKFKKT